MTLTEFLLARIAEDEAAARDAHYDGQVWLPEEEAVVAADRELEPVLYLDRKRDAAHAYRWSPARVLAECEAKRRIVELHSGDHECSTFDHTGEIDNCTWVISGDCSTMRLLALPYADHEDFREEWAL